MKSSHEIAQKQKEAKVFIPFSKKKGLPEIKSLTGTVYPDGVMEYEGKCIAIEFLFMKRQTSLSKFPRKKNQHCDKV